MLAIGSGLRRGELLGLRADVLTLIAARFESRAPWSGHLHDAADPQKQTVEARFKEPKTHGSRRTIPLPAFAIERLRATGGSRRTVLTRLGSGVPMTRWFSIEQASRGAPIPSGSGSPD